MQSCVMKRVCCITPLTDSLLTNRPRMETAQTLPQSGESTLPTVLITGVSCCPFCGGVECLCLPVWDVCECVSCWHENVCVSVLSRLFLGGAAPPYCPNIPPISVSEAAAPPIRMMACKADLYSVIITKQLHTCKYTAIDCAIVTLVEDRG